MIGMEDRLRDIKSKTLEKSSVLDVIASLETAASVAAELRDSADVKNAELQEALTIVEDFIRSRKLVLYGGVAINEHIPAKYRFYDYTKVLPDYDFFSPNAERDAADLVRALERAGLAAPAMRPGMHEGTYKVYVDYTAVADCTQLEPWIYKKLVGRAHVVQGLHYADADFLRMQMYLELSRPRGEVERWTKVYKRLLLLNRFAPFMCKGRHSKSRKGSVVGNTYYDECMAYVMSEGLVYAGANVRRLYERPGRRQSAAFGRERAPCIAFAEDPDYHAHRLEKILRSAGGKFRLVRWSAHGDLIPAMVGLKAGDRLVAVFVELGGCISYNELKVKGGQNLRIASLDTVIYLWFVFSFIAGVEGLVPGSFLCAAEDMVHVAMRTRDSGLEGVWDAFAVRCVGHQSRKASLIRAKVERKKGKTVKKRRTG